MDTKLLYDYHVWSFAALADHMEIHLPQVLYHERVSSGFSTIALTLQHIYLIDSIWYEAAQGHKPGFPSSEQEDRNASDEEIDMQDIKDRFSRLHERFSLLLSMPQTKWETEVRFKNDRGGETSLTLEEAIITMVNHGTYHRGAIASMLRQLGYAGHSVSFAAYIKTRKYRV
ncbi:DinB family protein [Paenibacillus tarimensis]